MARWTAKCWLGSANGYQDLEVQSNTSHGAREQFKRIYGAEQVINLRQVNESSSSSGGSDGMVALGAIGLFIYLVVTFWPIALALVVIYILYKAMQ